MPAVRRLAAVLAADVAGYSRLMGADEEATHERLKAHRLLVPISSPNQANTSDPPRTEVRLTLRWREMDSNFQYASTARWYRATDLSLPPTVKRRSAGVRLPWRDRVPRRSGVP